jgi:peptidyl-prolyl cis-trans isomerase D
VTTFEQALADLKKEIAAQRAADAILDIRDAIEDARAGGTAVDEIAAQYDLKVMTIAAVDNAGMDPAGKPVENLPAGLLDAAFQTDIGLENDPIEPDRSSYVWYTVTDITPPSDRTLVDVHDRVVAAWKDQQRQERLDTEAETVRGRLAGGEAIATVAADLSLTVHADKVRRRTPPKDELSPAVIQAAFSGPKGSVATAEGAQPMTKVVLVVDELATPPYFSGTPELTEAANQLNDQISNDLLTIYAAGLRSDTDVRFNQLALEQALGVSPN